MEALRAAADFFENEGLPLFKPLRSLLSKFDAKAKVAADEGCMTPAQIENLLVMYSSDKVVPITAARDIFWIKQYSTWKVMAPKPEQVELVARWLGRQAWLSAVTIDQVAYKWPQYLAKATAEGKAQTQVQHAEFTGED